MLIGAGQLAQICNLSTFDELGEYTFIADKPHGTLRGYCKHHCDKPDAAIALYTALGVPMDNLIGGVIVRKDDPHKFHWSKRSTVLDFVVHSSWRGGASGSAAVPDASSVMISLCYRGTARTQPAENTALAVPLDNLYPIQQVPFYDFQVPVPRDLVWLMQKEWGADVMRTIKVKTTRGQGSIVEMFMIPANQTAPALPMKGNT